MLDYLLILRIVLNLGSILFFLLSYKKLKYIWFLLLAIQCVLSLSLRVCAVFFYVDPATDLYNYVLILSTIINLVAAIYLYNNIVSFTKEEKK